MLEVAATHEQIVQAAVRVLRRIVQLMLTKHDHVHIIMAEGNHDQVGSIWLRVIFSTLYEGNSRVTVDTSELPYYVYEHGKTMLAFHHGHEKKPLTLPLYFAARHSEMWGRATKRYGHTGHCHHEQKAGDETGMHMTQHPTLAPNDSHSSRKAYVSINQASCIVYHSEFGKVGEVVVTPEMLLAA